MGKTVFLLSTLIWLPLAGWGQIHPPRPGWNLLSPQQDIQLGKEAASEVEQKYPLIHNSEVNAYLTSIGTKLAHTRYAGDYPYTFGLIADKAVDAFSDKNCENALSRPPWASSIWKKRAISIGL